MEPMTAITDFIVTIVCVIAFLRLRKISEENHGYMKYYPYFFLTMGLGCFFAAIMTHAIPYTMVEQMLMKEQINAMEWQDKFLYHLHDLPNWLLNILSVTLFEISMVERISKNISTYNRARYMKIAMAETAIVTILLLWKLNYAVAAAHIGFALYAIELPMMLKIYRETQSPEAKPLITGSWIMLIAIAAMAMQKILVEYSPWFNHNDISHCVIAITMYLFYQSAKIGMKDSTHVEMHGRA